MDLECAKTLLKNVFDGYSGEKNDLVLVMNELLVKSQQPTHTSEQVDDRDLFQDAMECSSDEEVETDFSFIKDKTTKRAERILERPAKTNQYHDEIRFCHPNNSRARISNATFKELKDTLNQWLPDNLPEKGKTVKIPLTEENKNEILERCLIKDKENMQDMEVIIAFKKGLLNVDMEFCYKVALFDKKKQLFLLRTGGNKKGAIKCGYTKALDIHSYDPEWFVDQSTLLSHRVYWSGLKEIVNSI